MFNFMKKVIETVGIPSGPPRAKWSQTHTYFEQMQGQALVANFGSREECIRELKIHGFKKRTPARLTSQGLEWERYTDWGTPPHLKIPNEARSLAVVDVESGTEMKRWEITAIFWDKDGNRLENLK